MNWRLFILAFAILFFAELGDKTQLAVFALASQHREPLPIFLGAASALVLITLIGTLFGEYTSKYLSYTYVEFIAGLLFVLMGLFILKDTLLKLIKQFIQLL